MFYCWNHLVYSLSEALHSHGNQCAMCVLASLASSWHAGSFLVSTEYFPLSGCTSFLFCFFFFKLMLFLVDILVVPPLGKCGHSCYKHPCAGSCVGIHFQCRRTFPAHLGRYQGLSLLGHMVRVCLVSGDLPVKPHPGQVTQQTLFLTVLGSSFPVSKGWRSGFQADSFLLAQ